MTSNPARDDPYNVEIDLKNDATISLRHLEVDTDRFPFSFEVHGTIEDDNGILENLRGKSLTPVAVRFEVHEIQPSHAEK